jgi:hypothetical protein
MAVLGLSMFSFLSCTGRINLADLVGRYRVEYPFGVETLTLNSEGTYVQEFMDRESTKVVTVRGSWRYDSASGVLVLENPLVIDYFPVQTSKQRATQVSGVAVFRVKSQSRISVNEDLGYYYKRVSEE